MSSITAQDVQALRKETGAGMMDAKHALEEAGGDVGRAKEILREKGLAAASKRVGKAQTEGAIGSYLHFQSDRPVIGVLVELASETDFVAKSEEFQKAANDIAMHISWSRPDWVRREDVPEDVVAKEREIIATQAKNEGKPEHIVEKIVEGRIGAFFEDRVLYDQKYVKAADFEGTVGELVQALAATMGENITVAGFCRREVGEGP